MDTQYLSIKALGSLCMHAGQLESCESQLERNDKPEREKDRSISNVTESHGPNKLGGAVPF
jgi:hypothetical protein